MSSKKISLLVSGRWVEFVLLIGPDARAYIFPRAMVQVVPAVEEYPKFSNRAFSSYNCMVPDGVYVQGCRRILVPKDGSK